MVVTQDQLFHMFVPFFQSSHWCNMVCVKSVTLRHYVERYREGNKIPETFSCTAWKVPLTFQQPHVSFLKISCAFDDG